MAHEILVDRRRQLITIRYSATVGVHDLRHAVRDVFAIDPGYRVCSDFTRVKSWRVSRSDLRSLLDDASRTTVLGAVGLVGPIRGDAGAAPGAAVTPTSRPAH